MRNYKELEIWKHSIELAEFIYARTKTLPSSEKYNLISQMQRAVISISSNIAGGLILK